MKVNYPELLAEVRFLTSPEGFFTTCLDIKEGMLFYDRDLLLSAYGATLELVAVSTLFIAGLGESDLLEQVESEIWESVSQFGEKVKTNQFPIDVQHLMEQYHKGVGLIFRHRFPVYVQSVASYRRDLYRVEPPIDSLLTQVLPLIGQKDHTSAEQIMGIVGAKMFRGAHLRPIWFKLAPAQLQMWLAGLQTVMNNLAVASYFSFPLEDIATERLKRGKNGEKVVYDLGAVRNLRRGLGGYTDQRIIINPDQCDAVIDLLLNGESCQALADQIVQANLKAEITLILPGIIEAATLVEASLEEFAEKSLKLLVALREIDTTAPLMIRLLAVVDPWTELFNYCLQSLKDWDLVVLPAISDFVATSRPDAVYLVLAEVLAQGEVSLEKFEILKEMFMKMDWSRGKGMICPALARHGGEQGRELLESTLGSLKEEEQYYANYLIDALAL